MKKLIVGIVLLATVIVIAESTSIAYSKIEDANNGTTSCTNYVGFARTSAGATAPSTNAAVWKIIQTVYDSNGVEITYKHAYGSGEGELALWSTAWSNRVSATYK